MSDVSENIQPTGITHNREEQKLSIDWNDGHQSEYQLNMLREICPCVECRGGHDRMGPQHDPDLLTLTPMRSSDIRVLELVGNYALQIWWQDNHSAGIYTWKYLRRMCMCEICIAERSEAG